MPHELREEHEALALRLRRLPDGAQHRAHGGGVLPAPGRVQVRQQAPQHAVAQGRVLPGACGTLSSQPSCMLKLQWAMRVTFAAGVKPQVQVSTSPA